MIRLSANVYYEDTENPNVESCLDALFYVSTLIDSLLGTKKSWYEKGYSRKKALEHKVFDHNKAKLDVIERWNNKIKKNLPIIIEGVWDGENDNRICSINYIKKHFSKPKKVNLDISITCEEAEINVEKLLTF